LPAQRGAARGSEGIGWQHGCLAGWLPGRLFQLFQDQQTRESTLNVKKKF